MIRGDGGELDEAVFARLLERMTFGRAKVAFSHPNKGAALTAVCQPMVPEDRYAPPRHESVDGNVVLVTDALLSNRRELAEALGWDEAQLADSADSALVMAAFERWGEACPVRLEGHFALAAWHRRERRLFCAVDAFSFRPLYYAQAAGAFVFASSLRGVLAAPGVPRRLNEQALLRHLVVVRDRVEETLYESVLRLPAAHTLTWKAGGEPVIRRYWQPDPNHRVVCASREEYLAAFQRELEQAVAFAVRSTGNVGMMLSGGLDSTAVAVMAADILGKQGKRLQVIHNLPSSYDPRRARLREHDESAWVRMLEPVLPGADFHYRTVQTNPLPMGEWDRFFDIHQVPLKGMPSDRSDEHAQLMENLGVTRMTNGLGGNYLVSLEALSSGYFAQLAWQGRWPTWWREARGCQEFYGYSRRLIFKESITAPLGHALGRRPPIAPARLQMLRTLHPRLGGDRYIMEQLQRVGEGPVKLNEFHVKRRLAQIMSGLMPQNVGVCESVFSPDYTISGCAPMLDRRLNTFCLGVPLEQQIRKGRDRLLVRDSLAGRVPEALRWRVTRGLPTPNFWNNFISQKENHTASLREFRSSSLVKDFVGVDEMERLLHDAHARQNTVCARTVTTLIMTGRFLQWVEKDMA